MFVVALTGNIGTGKTTVAGLFEALGIPHVDSDKIARELVQPGTPALAKIITHFGEKFLLPNGQLDRTQLRHYIFNHPEARTWLENLLHPAIAKKARAQLEALSTPYALYVIPLLIGREACNHSLIDRVLVVDTPVALQKERTLQRDGITETLFDAILATQPSHQQLQQAADDVLVNDNHVDHLKAQVQKLHEKYLTLSH